MRQVVVNIIDDRCGILIPEDEVTIVNWQWRGQTFESELCPKCVTEIEDMVTPLREISRPIESAPPKGKGKGNGGKYTFRGGYATIGSNGEPIKRFSPEQYAQVFGDGNGGYPCPICKSLPFPNHHKLRSHMADKHDRRLWEMLDAALNGDGLKV